MSKKFFRIFSVLFAICLITVSFSFTPKAVVASDLQAVPKHEFVTAQQLYIDTFDPALAYDTGSWQVIQQIYEPLITYNREKMDEFVPQLASSWEISADGSTYTFHIRPGVTFHEGQALTPEDVAYTFQRGILQGGFNSPQWLLAEPVLGIGIDDITGIVDGFASADNREALKANNPAVLLAACETVKSKIVANEGAGTVTMHLAQTWSPLLATLAGTWGSILDKGWVISKGGWDGSCATWQNYYAMTSAEDPLTPVANGTGPFSLDHYTVDDEVVFVRNPNYWRTTPMWPGGPSGLAKLARVTIKNVAYGIEGVDMLIAGNADYAMASIDRYPTLDPHVLIRYNSDGSYKSMGSPDGTLMAYDGNLGVQADVGMFNYLIASDSAYIGTGTWGTGIPVDFFSDIHIRKAFNYAFDWQAYINQIYGGYAIQTYGPIIKGLMGYADTQPHYSYNPSFAATEMAQAFGGTAAAQGFTFTCVYNEGASARQGMCEQLKTGIEALNPALYHINILMLDWPTYLTMQRSYRLPILSGGWLQDIPHPHNWVVPYLKGTYAGRQRLPQALKDKYVAKVDTCVSLVGGAARTCYEDIQTSTYADALDIFLVQSFSNKYLNASVKGYYYNPANPGLYYYALSKSITEAVVIPDNDTQVSFTNEQGDQVSFTIPAGTLQDSVQLRVLPDILTEPLSGNLMSSGVAFEIQGFLVSDGSPVKLTFDPPIPFTFTYNEGSFVESTLRLYYWNGTDWVDAACGEYVRDLEANTITVPICHFSQFQMGGSTGRIYLPAIFR